MSSSPITQTGQAAQTDTGDYGRTAATIVRIAVGMVLLAWLGFTIGVGTGIISGVMHPAATGAGASHGVDAAGVSRTP